MYSLSQIDPEISHALYLEGKRQKNHIFYGPNVNEKIERLYHSEEAALIMAHMEKLQEAA